MSRPLFLSFLAVALLAADIASSRSADRPPNVILILIDDMGWTDLSCYGSSFYETPNIDRLAASGMRLTHGYSACTVCSPTRAAVMTGKYPGRLHITDWIEGSKRPYAKLKVPDWRMHLPHEEITIAETFKANGYATCHIGKWHLGGPEYAPTTQGFDINIAGTHAGSPPTYFFPYKNNNSSLPGLENGRPGEYLTDRLTDEAIKFVSAAKDKPFFLYMPFYAVHTPLMAKPEKIAKYQAKAKPENPQHNATYAAMIESLDEGIGRLMAHLDQLKLRDNTIVVFTSDNGGLKLNQVTSNDPARAGKGSVYEGGIRVPYIFSYGPKIRAGATSDAAVMSIDLFPTLVELCGLSPKPEKPAWDGVSVASVLLEKEPTKRDTLYWHYPHYHPGGATPYGAVRSGDWRLVEFYENGKTELYNLKDDVGESKDLANSQPQKRDELLSLLRKWRSEVGAQMPTPNPEYNAERDAQQMGWQR
ncbi:MAG TPA: sulfatase [Pirellulaceae bacterium]|jgi:arylsulfatase A-like enzyme